MNITKWLCKDVCKLVSYRDVKSFNYSTLNLFPNNMAIWLYVLSSLMGNWIQQYKLQLRYHSSFWMFYRKIQHKLNTWVCIFRISNLNICCSTIYPFIVGLRILVLEKFYCKNNLFTQDQRREEFDNTWEFTWFDNTSMFTNSDKESFNKNIVVQSSSPKTWLYPYILNSL